MKIDIGNGVINIEVSGADSKPVVMMSHSLGCSLHMWDPQMDALARDYKVVRLDMRGHGLSDVTAGPYTLDGLADDVIAVMDQLNIDKAHWVGLSIGGMIGQSLLLRYPDRFLKAVLCDTSSVVPSSALPTWNERIEKVNAAGLESIADATMERWFTQGFLASSNPACETIRSQFVQTSDAGYVACCHAIMQLNYIERLSEIKTPVCLVVGAEDVATPVAASEAIHERIAGSELHILDNASHLSNVEQTEEFNAKLLPFLAA